MEPKNLKYYVSIVLSFLILFSCNDEQVQVPVDLKQIQSDPVELEGFEIMSDAHTGVKFENIFDVLKMKLFVNYVNVFNGGGVALGDINNDNLIDIYLTGNLVGNKLYLNKGNLQFEDITISAGVGCTFKWSTGATFADVNNDGFLDLYVCHSYDDDKPSNRANSLFINNGKNAFIESAEENGVADIGYSIQASFLDFDKDGYLDLFLGNTPRYVTGDFLFNDKNNHVDNFKNPSNLMWSDKLYRNNGNGKFTDVTKKAGILNYGYMLGVSVGDYNSDGWEDIFVAVDHGVPDYLYINNGDGTFTNEINNSFKHISLSSMGSDAADLNNDSKLDVVTLDMLSFDNYSEKTQMAAMNPESFNRGVEAGMHHQYMRNMLHLNQGNAKFTEVGQMAGIHKSDWSWSVLAADFSNDGHKDLFVTNGFYRSVMDKDLGSYFYKILEMTDEKEHRAYSEQYESKMRPQKNKNVLFKNNGDYTFENVAKQAGCDEDGFSSGAAYADLDNDGDLDLVINNIDRKATILRNKQRDSGKGNFVQLDLNYKKNIPNVGTKVELSTCNHKQYYEVTLSRGYQSSYTGPLNIGIGECNSIDYLKIIWPDGASQILSQIEINRKSEISYKPGSEVQENAKLLNIAKEDKSKIVPAFVQKENQYDDYKEQVLLPHKMSQFGPTISKGDVNNDGFEDFFIGGASNQSGALYLYDQASKNYQKQSDYFDQHKKHEDMGSVFFDLENDGDLDLYVVSGGNEFKENSSLYLDRLYLNNGKGEFSYSKGAIPQILSSGSCVEVGDFDNDGFADLFVGTRHVPHKYPFSSSSIILKNQNGKLVQFQEVLSGNTDDMGMVTDACFADINNDDKEDLIVVGEWMPVSIFINRDGQFKNSTSEYDLSHTSGWWNCIEKADIDNDDDIDFVLGNLGLNYKYQASQNKPFHIYAGDFDKNGSSDIVLGQYYLDDLFPVRGRQCSSEQMPIVAEKFPSYSAFGEANLKTVYGEYLDDAYHLQVSDFRSSILFNEGGSFSLKELPQEAQFSPINSIVVKDLNGDSLLDILAGGNLYASEVETGRADGGVGVILIQDNKGNFESIPSVESGLFIDKDVKNLTLINGEDLLVGNNNDELQYYRLSQ